MDPQQILVLTFRREAAELGTRITRTIRESPARTFHSYAYGVLRRAALLRGDAPARLLTLVELDAVVPSCSAVTPRRRATATRPRLPGR